MEECDDTLNFKDDEEIKEIIGDETIYFTDTVEKVKDVIFGSRQQRNLIITDQAIYNLKGKILRRKIEIKNLKGITISKISDQFVIHGNQDEYDYLFDSQKRIKIIELLQTLFQSKTHKNLIFCIKNEKDLNKYVVTKKERAKQPTLFKIDPKDFMSINEFLDSGGSMNINTHPNTFKLEVEFNKNYSFKENITFKDFKIISMIGKGNTSKIYLAIYDNEKVVLKVFDKKFIYNNDLIDKILLEKNILSSFRDEKFLIHMKFYFMTKTKLVFVLPFYRGGDLFSCLQRHGTVFDESITTFYIIQIAYMISFLHSKNIIYRDLKPENILINDNGYLILTDFGSCKVVEENTELQSSFIGSIDYMSPEIISGEGHNFMTDWWSYGVLIYELLFGIPPFHGESTERILDLICNSVLKYNSKIYITPVTKDIISRLLKKNPKDRMGRNEFNQIIQHHFFKGVTVNNILNQKITAPILPVINGDDLANFDQIYVNSKIEDFDKEEKNGNELNEECEKLFEEFKN